MVRGGAKFDTAISALGKKLSSARKVKVGFFEDASYPDGTPVAMIAAVQNFGAPSRGIPPRPFFTAMIKDHGSEWGGDTAELMERTDGDAHQTLTLMGELIEEQLRQSVVDTNDPALKPATIKRKGFEKPLVDTGRMLGSIKSKVIT